MRDLGTPVYGMRFFQRGAAAFPDSTRVFVVGHAGRPVAASIVHWHAATRSRCRGPRRSASSTRCAPTCSSTGRWSSSRSSRGFRTFDFGRSTPGEGTFHFKRQWGAEPRELVWEYWTADGALGSRPEPEEPEVRAWRSRAWQRLPVSDRNGARPAHRPEHPVIDARTASLGLARRAPLHLCRLSACRSS